MVTSSSSSEQIPVPLQAPSSSFPAQILLPTQSSILPRCCVVRVVLRHLQASAPEFIRTHPFFTQSSSLSISNIKTLPDIALSGHAVVFSLSVTLQGEHPLVFDTFLFHSVIHSVELSGSCRTRQTTSTRPRTTSTIRQGQGPRVQGTRPMLETVTSILSSTRSEIPSPFLPRSETLRTSYNRTAKRIWRTWALASRQVKNKVPPLL